MPIGLGLFASTAKSFDLAIKKTKIITKCKSFGYGLGGKAAACYLPYLP
jgi:hypothetical protein